MLRNRILWLDGAIAAVCGVAIWLGCTGNTDGDVDNDGAADGFDLCPTIANPMQENADGDGAGDVCDNCPFVSNTNQSDLDADGLGNECDNCPLVGNADQANADADGLGDACDSETCGDGMAFDPEDCDGGDLEGMACDDFEFDFGALACTSTCTWDFTGCEDSAGFAYAVTSSGGSSTVLQYAIGVGGGLYPLATPSVATAAPASSIYFGATGAYVISTDPLDAMNSPGVVSQYSVENGSLSPLVPATVATGNGPLYGALINDASHLLVCNVAAESFSRYSIAGTGELTRLTPDVATGRPGEPAVVGDYLYVPDTTGNAILQFLVGNDGSLSPLTPPSVALTGNFASMVMADPTGSYLYTAGGLSMAQFAIGGNGTLSPLTPATVSSVGSPYTVTLDSTGTYAVAVDDLGGLLDVFTVSATGQLEALSGAGATEMPSNVGFITRGAFHPSGAFYYLGHSEGILVYSIGANGLTRLPALDVSTGAGNAPQFLVTRGL